MELEKLKENVNASIDVIGILVSAGLPHHQTVSEGGVTEKLELTLCSKTGTIVEAVFSCVAIFVQNLWRGLGLNVKFEKGQVLAIKSIRVKDLSGHICLSSHDYTALDLDPQDETAKELRTVKLPPEITESSSLSEKKEAACFHVSFSPLSSL